MAIHPPAPFGPNLTGSPSDQMRQIADALSNKADLTSEPTYSAIMMIAPNRTVYKVTVSNTGALTATVVPRP